VGNPYTFVAVMVDVKQEKRHHQKENYVNARLKGLQKARQRFPHIKSNKSLG
jgi:hypothetical protein